MSETAVNSFVVRFTQDQDSSTPATWRGLIRHVQTNEETYFLDVAEALKFMAQYVEIGDWNREEKNN